MGLFDRLQNNNNNNDSRQASTSNNSVTVTFDKLPETLDELKATPEAALSTPFMTAALAVCAYCCYAVDKQIGKDMLNFLKGPKPLSNYDIQFINDRLSDKAYLPFSYFHGAVPSNDYRPDEPYRITFFEDPYSYQNDGYAKLNVRSGGADSPRQIVLRKKGDQWFLWEQYILVGIRLPASQDDWS